MYGIEYRKYDEKCKIIERCYTKKFDTKEEADISLANFGIKEGAYPGYITEYESHKILVSPQGPIGYFDVIPYKKDGVQLYKRTLLYSFQVVKIDKNIQNP